MEYINLVIDIFKENFYGQLIGFVAFLVSIYNFLFCKNKKFIIVTAIASLVWGIHFYSIGLIAAAFINIVDLFKNILALKYERSKKIASVFIVFYIIIGFISFEDYVSIIPTLTAIISTYLVFYIRGVWLNIGFMGVIILWGIYNFIGQSIGGLFTDITLFVTGIIGIVRIIISEKKNNKK